MPCFSNGMDGLAQRMDGWMDETAISIQGSFQKIDIRFSVNSMLCASSDGWLYVLEYICRHGCIIRTMAEKGFV
jgi:hypothetical protein